jgi:CheY-like chemotaxis protein
MVKMNPSPNTEVSRPILVVEDDKTSYMLIKEFLGPLNVQIHHVTDGTDAINFIKSNPDVRLILMDIKLPFMNGYEATKVIKQMNPGIPIIAQTAYALLGDREKALRAGCDDYITKPLDLVKFQNLIGSYLSN